MLVLFLDESGDHNLDRIDPQYPVFVLGGCIIDLDYHDGPLTTELNLYKRRLFGRDDIILHTADIVRCRGEFHHLTNPIFRERFYRETNHLMESLDYQVVACAIKKQDHLRRYGLAAMDPYFLSLKILVERFVFEVQARGGGEKGLIIAEARDETLDNRLRLAWMDLRLSGTEYLTGAEVRRRIDELQIRNKQQNIPGLQLADLVVSPIGRHVIGRRGRADWEIIKRKFRRGPDGRYKGFGLVVLPKQM